MKKKLKKNYRVLSMIIFVRRTYMFLERCSPLECLVIRPSNITGFNVMLRIGQYTEKFPLFEFFV
jgi:hypothetical protein